MKKDKYFKTWILDPFTALSQGGDGGEIWSREGVRGVMEATLKSGKVPMVLNWLLSESEGVLGGDQHDPYSRDRSS